LGDLSDHRDSSAGSRDGCTRQRFTLLLLHALLFLLDLGLGVHRAGRDTRRHGRGPAAALEVVGIPVDAPVSGVIPCPAEHTQSLPLGDRPYYARMYGNCWLLSSVVTREKGTPIAHFGTLPTARCLKTLY